MREEGNQRGVHGTFTLGSRRWQRGVIATVDGEEATARFSCDLEGHWPPSSRGSLQAVATRGSEDRHGVFGVPGGVRRRPVEIEVEAAMGAATLALRRDATSGGVGKRATRGTKPSFYGHAGHEVGRDTHAKAVAAADVVRVRVAARAGLRVSSGLVGAVRLVASGCYRLPALQAEGEK